MLEVKRPHVIGALRTQPLCRHGRLPEPAALAPTLRHPQPLLAPQPLHPLAVDLPALLAQAMVRAAVPPPRSLCRDLPQLRPQRPIVPGARGLVTLRGAMLPHIPARPALGQPQAVAQHRDRLTPPDRAHQFPLAISFNARFSNA